MPSLFGSFRFGTRRFASGSLTETLSTDLFVFDGFSLNNGTDIICSGFHESAPTRVIIGADVPRDDGQFQIADYWRNKTVTIEGNLTADTNTALETLLDLIKEKLRLPEKNLDITRNGVVRRFVTTLVNGASMFPSREHYNTNFLPFTFEFECRTPFGTDRNYTAATETITNSPHNIVVVNDGTYKTPLVAIFIVDAEDTLTVINIQRVDGAGTVLDEIEVTASGGFTAADTLEIDGESKHVKINGTEVDYTGSFPKLEVGSNIIKITSTSTSHTISCTLKYKQRFL